MMAIVVVTDGNVRILKGGDDGGGDDGGDD